MKYFWKTLLLSVLVVNLIAGTGIYIYRRSLEKRMTKWTIKQVLERGQGELPHGFLAEALDLSQDKPIAWDLFKTREAEKKLAQYPFFSKVKVRKIEPNAVLVDYVLRNPVARVADFSNRVIDSQGVVFPLEPYYSPKRLPGIRFGGPVTQSQSELSFALMLALSAFETPPRLLLIDFSESMSPSFGRRKIVITLEENIFKEGLFLKQPILLQLSADDPFDSLQRWKRMRSLVLDNKSGKAKGIVVDLKLPHLAYIQ